MMMGGGMKHFNTSRQTLEQFARFIVHGEELKAPEHVAAQAYVDRAFAGKGLEVLSVSNENRCPDLG